MRHVVLWVMMARMIILTMTMMMTMDGMMTSNVSAADKDFIGTTEGFFERYVRNGGFVFVDDCNHDVDGLFAKSFEAQMASIFGPEALRKLPNDHALYNCFFRFPDGPPTTSFELNGWGDDLVHDYLKGIEIDGRLGVLYSNKDYGCEWDYDWRNKRFLAEDNTKFAVNIVIYALTA